jgi:hypothetical protein
MYAVSIYAMFTSVLIAETAPEDTTVFSNEVHPFHLAVGVHAAKKHVQVLFPGIKRRGRKICFGQHSDFLTISLYRTSKS